ncbi:MAG: alkaline phosphatase D family protein [Myxococcota bacterium]
MSRIDRRGLLAGLAATALAPTLSRAFGDHPGDLETGPIFRHGVASGDPLARRVILWTRVTPPIRVPFVRGECRIYSDARLRRAVGRYRFVTGPWLDYTVKIDAFGLNPGTTYYYRFVALGEASPIGRTRTLPDGRPDHLRMAVASCSNFPAGYFAGYRRIAEREDLDLVLHLGDYIYEYGEGEFGTGASISRVPSPTTEITTLGEYRQRHAQYKADRDLQEAHRQHPFIAVWDDHETANDAWQGGAENHQPGEGDWEIRKAQARRAYFEWMPIRDPGGLFSEAGRIFRGFSFGDLAQIDMLDTRLFGREEQLPAVVDPLTGRLLVDPAELPAILAALARPDRQLLGPLQESWLFDRLERRTSEAAQWNVIGQQVMMGQLQVPIPGTTTFLPLNMDQWDGYPSARARLLSAATASGSENVVVLTGDIHSSWSHELALNPYDPTSYDPTSGRGSLGVEFVTPGITSPGIDATIAPLLEARILAGNPQTRYVNLSQRGYLVLDVDRYRARCEWYHLANVLDPDSSERLAQVAESVAGTRRVTLVEGVPMAARAGSPPPAPGDFPDRTVVSLA